MDSSTFINLIVGAASAMTTAIAFLFRTVIDLHRDQRDLSEKFGELNGRQKGIEELSEKVLAIVHRNTKK